MSSVAAWRLPWDGGRAVLAVCRGRAGLGPWVWASSRWLDSEWFAVRGPEQGQVTGVAVVGAWWSWIWR